jgi:Na+/H+-dicarboxylate symporter/ABC-type amino acid transport substrate-binding protein
MTRPEAVPASSRGRRSLSARIAIGLASGLAVGLFVGERAAVLQVVADAYVKLLQMTVLPYVTVSIVASLGALDARQARLLGKRVGALLALLWMVALVAVCLFPLMFPVTQNASFFSTTLVEEREPFDFLALYIPSNPFSSLANNIVPAVVLFSVVVGAALIAVPGKQRLLDVLEVAGSAVSKVTGFVVELSPLGLAAIGAVIAGTLRLEELQRLQVYLVSYVGMSLLLSLWVLPGLVAALTPVPYRALLSSSRDALIMAFMTASLFAVLPLLTERAKALVREHAASGDPSAADVIIPASFNFPHTGKLLSLSFVVFGAWFADARLGAADYPQLAATGLLAMFGSANAAIPFLLDLFRIPADTFQLFVASGVVNARFGTLVAAVHTLVVAVLGTCAVSGALAIDSRKLIRFGLATLILTTGTVGGIRFLLQEGLVTPYEKDRVLAGMQLSRDRGEARVFDAPDHAPSMPAVTTSVLDRVRERGVLRVGYFDDSLPYAFVNQRGDLVGFDVEMALQLARDLGVELELVRIDRATLEAGLDPSVCDLVMSGAAISADRAGRLLYSSSYLDETIAFVVPDHLARRFSEWSRIREMGRLRLGVPRAPYYIRKIRDELHEAEIVPFDRLDDMFAPGAGGVDAFVATAERGSAYTLLHPGYSVAVPRPRPFKVPLAYVIAGRDAPMAALVDTWIELKRKDGTIDELFAHWILGQESGPPAPRWSIMRDVLHWTR